MHPHEWLEQHGYKKYEDYEHLNVYVGYYGDWVYDILWHRHVGPEDIVFRVDGEDTWRAFLNGEFYYEEEFVDDLGRKSNVWVPDGRTCFIILDGNIYEEDWD